MKIAIHGLGRMGMQITQKLVEGGHEVVAHNRSADKTDQAKSLGAIAAYDKQSVINNFENSPVVLWLMIPANVVDTELDDWLKLLPKSSIVIDGGNSDFRQTKIRADRVSETGNSLVDIGTSGGIWGYENGFSMMAGGSHDAFVTVEPALKTLSAPRGGYVHFGESGAGHFVKMTHNAIEYGMMESLAEGYRLLKEGPYKGLNLADAGRVWQQSSVVTSWLNDLTKQILEEDPELDGIDGIVAESGEARWALEVADAQNLSMPAIQSSFNVRLSSQKGDVNFSTKLLAAMRNKFGGHDLNEGKS